MTHTVRAELIYLSVRDGDLFYRTETIPLPCNVEPAQHLLQHLQWDTENPEAMLHSTSWRYQSPSTLVLTWAVVPDPNPGAEATPVASLTVPHGSEAHRPVPAHLTLDGVVAHTVRHVAFLLHADPTVGAVLHSRPGLHEALLATHPDVAGNPHASH